jgi:hypothetical protein
VTIAMNDLVSFSLTAWPSAGYCDAPSTLTLYVYFFLFSAATPSFLALGMFNTYLLFLKSRIGPNCSARGLKQSYVQSEEGPTLALKKEVRPFKVRITEGAELTIVPHRLHSNCETTQPIKMRLWPRPLLKRLLILITSSARRGCSYMLPSLCVSAGEE